MVEKVPVLSSASFRTMLVNQVLILELWFRTEFTAKPQHLSLQEALNLQYREFPTFTTNKLDN